MSQPTRTPVMDVTPWPDGQGFEGGREWWDYMLSQDEKRRLDNLMGVAMLDQEIGERLLSKRDGSLLDAFGLSKETQARLRTIKATTLHELARGMMSVYRT